MADINHVEVDSKESGWHAGFKLKANQDYLIKPNPHSTYTLDGGIHKQNFHGSEWMDGSLLGIPAKIRLGGLAVLVWHHRPDGAHAIPEIISFPPGKEYAYANIGPDGGSIHFIIGDHPNTYSDNSGICQVEVILDDNSELIRPLYPISADASNVVHGYAKWTVGDTGFVTLYMKGTYSGLKGSARFSSCLLLVNKFGSPIYATAGQTLTVGAKFPEGTHTKEQRWTDLPAVPPEILKTARGAIVQLGRDTGGGDLLHQVEVLGKDFERLDKVYKTFKDSELVKDIVLVVAAG